MEIIGLNHVQITIPSDVETQARAFYCGLLGLVEIEKAAALRGRGGFWLQVGVQQVHVSLEDGPDRWQTKAHIAYEVNDLAAWRERLLSAEIILETQPPIPNYIRTLFRDPFGNRIELLQRV